MFWVPIRQSLLLLLDFAVFLIVSPNQMVDLTNVGILSFIVFVCIA